MRGIKKIIYTIYILLIFLIVPGRSSSQESSTFSQIIQDITYINPAYNAHLRGYSAALLHREQWVGFDGAPATTAFNYYHSLPWHRLGAGLNVFRESIGLRTISNITTDLNVNLMLSNRGYLSFGMRLGAEICAYNIDEAVTNEPGGASQFYFNQTAPTVGFGAYLYGPNYFMGASTVSVVSYRGEDLNYLPGFDFYAGYLMPIDWKQSWYFKPAILAKHYKSLFDYNKRKGNTFYLSANAVYEDQLWFGTNYRWQESVGLSFDIRLWDKLRLGYSYDIQVGPVIKYGAGSHEVRLSIRKVNKWGKRLVPIYYHFN